MPKKNTLLILLLIAVSMILMTYQSRKGYLLGSAVFSTVLNTLQSATSSVTGAMKNPFRSMLLREEENRALRSRINELLAELERSREALLENKRLRELLRFSDTQKQIVTAARVIGRGSDHWAKVLVLDRGVRHGVGKDMSAVTPKGLAGKILSVTDSFSHLLLLTDINFSTSVRLQEGRNEGIISGTGARKCVLKYIPYEEDVKAGDIVITSGLDALFPPGIPVGYVSKIEKGGTGHFQYIEVIPFQDDSKIEEALIVR